MSTEAWKRNYEQGRVIAENAPQLYIDLDVESDGIAGRGSLLSIGAVTPWGDTFYRELRPMDEYGYIEGNREFCEVHGLAAERLRREGMPPNAAMADLDNWVRSGVQRYGKRAAVLVAFNASYDFPLIDLEFKRAGIETPFGVAGYCIKSLAAAITPDYNWSLTSKSKLPDDVRPDGDFTHNALEDAEYQQRLHFALVGKIQKEPR